MEFCKINNLKEVVQLTIPNKKKKGKSVRKCDSNGDLQYVIRCIGSGYGTV